MAENNTPVEKKVLVSYTITRYSDGAIDVDNNLNAKPEAALGTEEIYNDITDVAKIIDRKRIENSSFVGAYNGIAKFYRDMAEQNAQNGEENQG